MFQGMRRGEVRNTECLECLGADGMQRVVLRSDVLCVSLLCLGGEFLREAWRVCLGFWGVIVRLAA